MRAGKLRHQVTIQSPTLTADGGGGNTVAWVDVDDVWADVKPLTGAEPLFSAQLNPETTHQVTLRYRSDLQRNYQIVFGTRTLRVTSIINVDERDRQLIAMCKEVGVGL